MPSDITITEDYNMHLELINLELSLCWKITLEKTTEKSRKSKFIQNLMYQALVLMEL